jgi:hypothetical protein
VRVWGESLLEVDVLAMVRVLQELEPTPDVVLCACGRQNHSAV